MASTNEAYILMPIARFEQRLWILVDNQFSNDERDKFRMQLFSGNNRAKYREDMPLVKIIELYVELYPTDTMADLLETFQLSHLRLGIPLRFFRNLDWSSYLLPTTSS